MVGLKYIYNLTHGAKSNMRFDMWNASGDSIYELDRGFRLRYPPYYELMVDGWTSSSMQLSLIVSCDILKLQWLKFLQQLLSKYNLRVSAQNAVNVYPVLCLLGFKIVTKDELHTYVELDSKIHKCRTCI